MKLPAALRSTVSTILLRELLEQLPQAALLVTSRQQVLTANTLALQLSAYTAQEIEGMPLARLFPLGYESSDSLLQDRYGRHHPVVTQTAPLGENYLLVKFLPKAQVEAEARRVQDLETLLATGAKLFRLLDHLPVTHTLDQALEHWREISQADWVAFYKPDPPLLRLTAHAGALPTLPTQLLLSELMDEGSTPQLHPPLRRSASPGVQRLRTSVREDFLFTFRIGPKDAWTGWVVVGYHIPPPTHAPTVLQYCSDYLALWHQRHEALNALQEHLEKVDELAALGRALLYTVPYPILLVNFEGHITGLNHQAEETLGYTRDEVLGWPVDHVLITESPLRHYVELTIGSESAHALDETTIFRRSGHQFPARLFFIPVLPKYEASTATRVAILIQDRSHEQVVEHLRQRAHLGTLLANFAHEIRNPLNNLSTGLEWLSISLPEQDLYQDTIRRLAADLDRLTEMTDRLLDYARPREYHMAPLHIEQLLHSLLERQRPRFHKYGINIQFHADAELPLVHGDEVALEQVFVNLFNNAIEALKENSGDRILSVMVRRSQRSGYIEVLVGDNGPGIPEEIRRRIFEPFFTTREHGHGLGLAITRSIINVHRGTITVESIPGATVFRVELPVAKT